MANQLECKFIVFITGDKLILGCFFLIAKIFYVFRYHHTGPVSGFFGLREGLAILAERVKLKKVKATETFSKCFVLSFNIYMQ